MLCLVLVDIIQLKKVINNFCYVSENIIFSNIKTELNKKNLIHFRTFQAIKNLVEKKDSNH